MKYILQQITDWAEVWALLIPLAVLFVRRPVEKWVKPLKYYLLVALIINLAGNLIWKRIKLDIDEWLLDHFSFFYNADGSLSNTVLYNTHSIIRFLLFVWFFHYVGSIFKIANKLVPPLFLLTFAIIFIYYKDIRDFSSLLMGSEAALLLFYCLIYYLIMLRDEDSSIKRQPSFWVVTGLSVYVVINFPIFLFYTALSNQSENFAINIWDLHNITYIIFCIFLAKAFYESKH